MPDESTTQPPEYLRRVNAALALRDVPDYEAALLQLSHALVLAPEDMSILLLLGLTYQDLGQLESARQKLRQAHKIAPDSNQVSQSLGLLLVENEQYDEALSLFESLLHAGVHDPVVSQGLATSLENLGRNQEAIQVLEDAHSHFPDDTHLASQLGHLLLRARRIDEAQKILIIATNQSANSDNLMDLAYTFIRQKRFQKALPLLEQAIQISSEDSRLWRAKTRCLLELDSPQRADEAARVALSLNEEDPRNWHNLAQSQFASEDYDKAFDALERSIELLHAASDISGLRVVMFDRAFKTLRVFGVSRALKMIEKDLLILPEHEGLRQLQIDLLIATSQYADALTILDEASALGQTLGNSHWEYFHVYYGLNRPDDAWFRLPPPPDDPDEYEEYLLMLEMTALNLYRGNYVLSAQDIFQKILAVAPTRTRSLNNLGFILAGVDEWEKAEELLRKALQCLEDGQEDRVMTQDVILANLGYVYIQQHQYDEAIRMLEQAEKFNHEEDQAILRIAYWLKGEFSVTSQERYPKTFIDTLAAIRANLATAYFLKGDVTIGLDIAQSIVDDYPEMAVGYRLLGCIHYSAEDPDAARIAWEQALKHTYSAAEQELIEAWLDKLTS